MYDSPFFFFFVIRNIVARKRVAFQCATDARITINAFYGNYSDFLCFGENLSQYLMEKNIKFVLNDVKATAFSVQKGAT